MSDGFPEKMDALDLIINALKDHEKRLDEISHQLHNVLQEATIDIPKVEEALPPEPKQKRTVPHTQVRLPRIQCTDWLEFVTQFKSQKATLVTYQVDETAFSVSTMTNDFILTYTESLPQKRLQVTEDTTSYSFDKSTLDSLDLLEVIINRRLKCGLALSISSHTTIESGQPHFVLTFTFPSTVVKNFLKTELGIPPKNIVAGDIIS